MARHKLYAGFSETLRCRENPEMHLIYCGNTSCKGGCPFHIRELVGMSNCVLLVLNLKDERPVLEILRDEATWRLWMHFEGFTPGSRWEDEEANGP